MNLPAIKGEGDFDFLRRLVHERAAIVLEANQSYMLEARLNPIAIKNGCPTVSDLLRRLRTERYGPLHKQVVEAMTTNETFFFRDLAPFQALQKEVLPTVLATNADARQLTIWCAAASSGQEPYSVAMVLKEHFPQLSNWKVEIHASDLSDDMLERIRNASYSQLEVNRGLPAQFLVKYFTRAGVRWSIKPELTTMVQTRKVNLIESWPSFPPLDVVFLRNVLIYFDVPTRRAVLKRVREALAPDGYLFLGGAETTTNIDDAFERVQAGKAAYHRIKR